MEDCEAWIFAKCKEKSTCAVRLAAIFKEHNLHCDLMFRFSCLQRNGVIVRKHSLQKVSPWDTGTLNSVLLVLLGS